MKTKRAHHPPVVGETCGLRVGDHVCTAPRHGGSGLHYFRNVNEIQENQS